MASIVELGPAPPEDESDDEAQDVEGDDESSLKVVDAPLTALLGSGVIEAADCANSSSRHDLYFSSIRRSKSTFSSCIRQLRLRRM